MEKLTRPDSSPKEGQIDAYDAGWNAFEIGLERDTVRVISGNKLSRDWALLAWDTAKLIKDRQN